MPWETHSTSLALCVGNPPVTGGFPSEWTGTCGFHCLLSDCLGCLIMMALLGNAFHINGCLKGRPNRLFIFDRCCRHWAAVTHAKWAVDRGYFLKSFYGFLWYMYIYICLDEIPVGWPLVGRLQFLTYLPLVPCIYVSESGQHGSDNGMSPIRRQGII